MKRYVPAAILVLILLGMCFMVGCDSLIGWTWKFRNRSSYTITISPNGQVTWVGFLIGPGQDHEVTVKEDGGTIYYTHDHCSQIRIETNPQENNWITIYNL